MKRGCDELTRCLVRCLSKRVDRETQQVSLRLSDLMAEVRIVSYMDVSA